MSENVLELKDISVCYDGHTVLDVPRLSVRRGEILTLLGENGSGKTTLLRLFGLLIQPARGRVFLGGREVDFSNARHLLAMRRRLAAVMQEPLLCRMSVRRNAALGLRFRGVSKLEAEQRVNAWLERLAISHLGERSAAKLSGGEAQRVSLARAMVLNPEVLFLDEPFAALDAPTRQSQLQEFQAVLAESGVTTIFATHDRGEALALGDRVAVLMRGRVAQVGTAETVFSRPASVEVARFVGVETLILGRIADKENGIVRVDCGALLIVAQGDCEVGEDVCVAVRPEEIDLLGGSSSDDGSGRNVIQGAVTRIVPAETHFRVEIDCGFPVVAVVNRPLFRKAGLEIGGTVRASFDAQAAHLIRCSNARDRASPMNRIIE